MKYFKKIVLYIFILTNSIDTIIASKINVIDGFILTSGAKKIDYKQLVEKVKDYPVIFVGDHHNTVKTHKFFYLFLEALVSKGYKIHLANEWFTPKHNKLLEEYLENKINASELREQRLWDKEISTRWSLLKNSYELIKQSKGGLYGINIPNDEREKISLKLFDKMNQDEKNFFAMLDLNNIIHKYHVMPMFEHCKDISHVGNEPCDKRMYRVQVAWDTYMARESSKLTLKVLKTREDKLIVFAGNFHVDKNLGIPLRFMQFSEVAFFTILNKAVYDINDNTNIEDINADAVFFYSR